MVVNSQLLHLTHQGSDLVVLQLQLTLLIVQLLILLGQLLLYCLHCLKTTMQTTCTHLQKPDFIPSEKHTKKKEEKSDKVCYAQAGGLTAGCVNRCAAEW